MQAAAAIVTEAPLHCSATEGAVCIVEEDGVIGGWRKMIGGGGHLMDCLLFADRRHAYETATGD